MYLITGATGHVGSIVARDLLSNGKKVRVVSRHGDKMKEFVNSGADALLGDLINPRFINRSFEGINAALCMLPIDNLTKTIRKDRQRIARNYVDAVKKHGTKYVILLSSVGAHMHEGCGAVDGLADMEIYFSELKDVNVLCLRPGYFMENLYYDLNTIRNNGIIASVMRGDKYFPVIASKDVAAVAVKRLLALDFKGHSIEYVLGPKDLNFNEITGIVGKAINRPELKYIQLSKSDIKKGMIESGFISENVAESYAQMVAAFDSGEALNDYSRTPQNSSPTTLEEFVKDVAYVYHHQTAA